MSESSRPYEGSYVSEDEKRLHLSFKVPPFIITSSPGGALSLSTDSSPGGDGGGGVFDFFLGEQRGLSTSGLFARFSPIVDA